MLELIPVLFGILVAVLGFGLIFDAWTPDDIVVRSERRRSPRIERSRKGEAAVGFGVLCMAAAFLGRDTWVYSVIAVMLGTLLLVSGGWANRSFLRQAIGNRGSLRRR